MNREKAKEYFDNGGYIEGVGKRKTAIARVRISLGKDKSNITVNNLSINDYFKTNELVKVALESLQHTEEPFNITVSTRGGGVSSQAEAVRHGVAIALSLYDPDLRKDLKRLKFIRRDARRKERKKPGLRGARAAPQWSKR